MIQIPNNLPFSLKPQPDRFCRNIKMPVQKVGLDLFLIKLLVLRDRTKNTLV